MRYILVDDEAGIFLGAHKIPIFGDPKAVEGYLIFSNYNAMDFQITKAYSFDSIRDALLYANTFLIKDFPDLYVEQINTEDKYVDVVDLIKSGFGAHTHSMIDHLDMPSNLIH